VTHGSYPNSTPEFRLLQKTDGVMILQIRYINAQIGYVGKWMDVPIVQE
jgi:hypothetical protein